MMSWNLPDRVGHSSPASLRVARHHHHCIPHYANVVRVLYPRLHAWTTLSWRSDIGANHQSTLSVVNHLELRRARTPKVHFLVPLLFAKIRSLRMSSSIVSCYKGRSSFQVLGLCLWRSSAVLLHLLSMRTACWSSAGPSKSNQDAIGRDKIRLEIVRHHNPRAPLVLPSGVDYANPSSCSPT